MTNVLNTDGVLTATGGGTGTIVWPMKTPYQFVGGTLAASGDGYAFAIGFLDPKDWRKTVYTPLATLAEFDAQFKGRTADAREYWLRCTLTGGASLSALSIQNHIQMAPLAMPSMTVGSNRFTYLEQTDAKTGANTARHLCGPKQSAGRGSGQQLYLARAPRNRLREQRAYEFSQKADAAGRPLWTDGFAQAQPVFADLQGVTPGSVVYHPGLQRYLLTCFHVGPGQRACSMRRNRGVPGPRSPMTRPGAKWAVKARA